MMDIVIVSGGFDPLHKGHIEYIKGAAKYDEDSKVMVLLNSDDWLMRKKGYVFMTWDERKAVIEELYSVGSVYPVDDSDDTVVKGLQELRGMFPADRYRMKFAKGGDRGPDNTPEAEWCGHLGIEMLYDVGGAKTQSSSELVKRVNEVLAHG